MADDIKSVGAYLLGDPRETFAELYAAMYALDRPFQNGFFNGFERQQVIDAFPASIAAIRGALREAGL